MAGSVRRADEQSCANLPSHFNVRDRSMPKAAALQVAVQMVAKVSSSVIVRLPSALLHITRHPALAVRVRSCSVKASRRAFDSSCSAKLPTHEALRVQCGWTVRKPRRGSASRAAALLVVLTRSLWCMEQLMASLHAPFLPRTQPTRTVPWDPLLG